jgi:charged multivesicular body protein 2A
MKEEMMADQMDDAFADDEDEDEEEEILGAVFAELGVGLANELGDAPSGQVAMPSAGGEQKQVAATAGDGGGGGGGGDDLDDELQRRLDNLRRT